MKKSINLVIRIPEDEYQNILHTGRASFCAVNAIKAGTVLPKGCGRLGDLDALEREIINGIKAGNYEEGYETFAHINNVDDCLECVKYADTIIEADKETGMTREQEEEQEEDIER